MEPLRGKNILIAGATGDIGFHTARLLQGSGAQLFLTGRNAELLQTNAQQLGLLGNQYLSVDLSMPEAGEKLAKAYFELFPTIDILINAAGIGIIKPLEQLTEEDMLNSLQVNLLLLTGC
jgi:short-subunit dehydrogenase